MDNEILDIVDSHNIVIGSATREEIYARKHIHRIVHVIVRNKKGEFLMQLRSEQSRYLPLHWSTSVGGHVQTGEDFETAAKREMIEEIGINCDISELDVCLYQDDRLQKFLGIYEATVDDGFEINPEEVADIKFMDQKTFEDMIVDGAKIHPELLFIWNKFYRISSNSFFHQ
jgi:isopentenyl-diphosphate Delta-isomerase